MDLCNIFESIKILATLTLQHFLSFQNPCNMGIATIANVAKKISSLCDGKSTHMSYTISRHLVNQIDIIKTILLLRELRKIYPGEGTMFLGFFLTFWKYNLIQSHHNFFSNNLQFWNSKKASLLEMVCFFEFQLSPFLALWNWSCSKST